MKDNIDYIINYINNVENNYPKLINSEYNNDLVKNINRKTIELVKDSEEEPYPLNILKKKQHQYIQLTDKANKYENTKLYREDDFKTEKEFQEYDRALIKYDQSDE